MSRLYSTLEIKSIDEEQRKLTGVASTISTDRQDDIVEPKGAQYKLPIPFLWQHKHSEPVGWVTGVRINAKQIEVDIEIAKISEDGKLKERIDEAWQSLKAKLVRGLSIGFRALEYAQIEGSWGVRFTSWEWLELSAVTIPANAEATIQTIKSYDDAAITAFGTKAAKSVVKEVSGNGNSPGVTGKNIVVKLNPSGGKSMNIREQIEAYEKALKEKTASMTTIMEKSAESGLTLDAAQAEEYDGLEQEVAAIKSHVERLKKLEVESVAKAAPVAENRQTFPIVTHVQAKAEKPVEKGIKFARYAMCLVAAQGNAHQAAELAKSHYPQSEDIIKTLEFQAKGGKIGDRMKAVVEAGTTLDSTWAAPLVDYQNFAGDFVEYLRPRTIIGRFGTDGIPALNSIPFNVRITGQTSGGSASWVGEGAPKPLTKFDFNATELRWAKIASIAVVTNELIRFSNPSAERLVRDALAGAVIERADLDFIDPSKAAEQNVSPASITYGAFNVPSSGDDADAIRADVQALWAPFIAARNAPRNAVFIMDSTTALALSLMNNPLGQREFPDITINGGRFMGIPVIVSDYTPADSDGSIVILANASDIWLADDGQVTISASREASLQMLDNPTNNSASGTATAMVSMFQTNSTAILAERYINWARRRASGVAYLTGVRWGQ